MHSAKVGTVVGLSPPYGVFGFKEKKPTPGCLSGCYQGVCRILQRPSDKAAVLVSAGIGITPMKCFLESKPKRVRFVLHVDKNEAEHPFKAEVDTIAGQNNHMKTQYWYTSAKGRPTAEQLVSECLKPYIKDCDFYLCASPELQGSLKKALEQAGAEGVYVDSFSPELAHL